jgi:predicted amidophosphoribosyltransferase
MWFAVHPIGLIVVLIVMACLQRLKECPQCMQKMKSHARLCAFCGYRFTDAATMPMPSARHSVRL